MDGVSYAVLGEAAGISGLGVDIPTFATVPYGGIKAAAVVGSMPIQNPATQANGCPRPNGSRSPHFATLWQRPTARNP